jgi:hypothetical protein
MAQERIDKAKLKAAIEQYSGCQTTCAEDLAVQLVDSGVDVALSTVGVIKSSPKLPNALKVLTFYAFARNVYTAGGKIINDNAACYQKCDDLSKAIVTLGRAGALGPMKRDEAIDPEILKNAKVLDAYQQFIKPIPLPAEERSKEWGKYIESLS